MLQEATAQGGLLQLLGGSVLGLFGGFGATALWEGLIRPSRVRKNTARLLVAEIRMNAQQVQWMLDQRTADPEFLPLNLSLATNIFDARTEEVADLPEELLQPLVELYTRFRNLSEIGATLPKMLDEYEETADEDVRKTILHDRIVTRIEKLYGGLDRAKAAIDDLLPKLLRCARFESEPPAPA